VSVAIAIRHLASRCGSRFANVACSIPFLGAIVLGLAIASMHYSGMEATRFLPASSPLEAVSLVLSESHLALATAVTLYVVCGTCLIVFAVLVFRPRTPKRDHFRMPWDPAEEVVQLHEDGIVFSPPLRQEGRSEPVSGLAFIERRLLTRDVHEHTGDNDRDRWREHRKRAH
jgi:Bacterial signalling protein N terminal repeat